MSSPYPGDSRWPADFSGCTLTGRYVGLDGSPVVGSITLSASPDAIFDLTSAVVVVPRGLTINLDANGSFSITVPATDDPDISPRKWTYRVSENFTGGRIYSIAAPMGATIDITEAAPVPNSLGNPILRGPTGRGVSGVTIDSFGHLIVSFTDGSHTDAGAAAISGDVFGGTA